jgi:signal peptidase I
MDSSHASPPHSETGVVDTLQSLIVAFVLAMTFRGFVAEGFVIPTGSMAPTLMGQHVLMHSTATGYTFPAGVDQQPRVNTDLAVDPMLGPGYSVGSPRMRVVDNRPRAGDRILVLKGLYSFSEPSRFDVVVFKNPTDPKGEAGNYIKRLIGLPNETIWLADGDVFARPDGERDFRIQRKPEHIQRALWQPIYNSDYELMYPDRINRAYTGPPWRGAQWQMDGRVYRLDTDAPAMLEWDITERQLNDWAMYNMLGGRSRHQVPVSDLRIAAGIVADEAAYETTLELHARSHVFEFSIMAEEAIVRYRPVDQPDGWVAEQRSELPRARAGRVRNVEFWHVDQSMRIFIGNREIVRLDYDWTPRQRVNYATGLDGRRAMLAASNGSVEEVQLRWHFSGSPVTLHRVQVDRDLHYRAATLEEAQQRNEPIIRGQAFGTHPEQLAEMGPDQFYMLGDNSQASLDSRLWGSPHPLVATQIDPDPFIVHRDLLLGKAWVVYFPAMYSATDGGRPIVPDFGRLRYIR